MNEAATAPGHVTMESPLTYTTKPQARRHYRLSAESALPDMALYPLTRIYNFASACALLLLNALLT